MLKLTFINRNRQFTDNSTLSGVDSDSRIFNAYTHERFFFDENASLGSTGVSASLDKFVGIDEMVSANITHRVATCKEP